MINLNRFIDGDKFTIVINLFAFVGIIAFGSQMAKLEIEIESMKELANQIAGITFVIYVLIVLLICMFHKLCNEKINHELQKIIKKYFEEFENWREQHIHELVAKKLIGEHGYYPLQCVGFCEKTITLFKIFTYTFTAYNLYDEIRSEHSEEFGFEIVKSNYKKIKVKVLAWY